MTVSASLAIAFACCATFAAQEGASREVGAVRSGDGLEVGLAADGSLARVEQRGAPFDLAGGGGFVVTDVAALFEPVAGEAPRVANASFEQDGNGDAWPDGFVFVDFWGSGGGATWDATTAADGARSLRLDGSGGEAIESPPIAVAPGDELLLQASRTGAPACRCVAFWFDASWSLLGAVLGEPEPGRPAFAPLGRVVRAPPHARWLLPAWQKLGAGPLWIDSLRVVAPSASARARADGVLLPDPARRHARQHTRFAALELDLVVEWLARPRGLVAVVDVIDRRGGERALDVEWAVPLSFAGATLQAEPRATTKLAPKNLWGEYQELEHASPGRPFGDGSSAAYPLLAVAQRAASGGPALAVGVAPGEARPFRLRARTEPGGGVVASFPIGLSPAPLAASGRARVVLFLAGADAAWPLRSGLEQMARLFPRYGERRFGAAGTWIAFTDPATLPGVADFGFAVHEGDNAVASDDALGIASFCYVEPWDAWVDLGDHASQPSYADALARIASQQAGGSWPPRVVDLARAIDVGGQRDAAGALLHKILQRPWISGSGWSCLVSLNPEEGLGDDLGRNWPAPFDHFAATIDASAATWGAQGAALDGAYLDSMSTYFADSLDFRDDQWEAIRGPLTWERSTRKVALWPPSQVAAVAAAHAERERAAGRLLMGNALETGTRAAALHFDYLGIEANWSAGPESDATLLWRRVAAFRRPFCLLQNTDFAQFSHAEMQAYMRRCLFYGHFASCFSADAATAPYFEDPALYGRDRGLFVRYVPLVRELDLAGWRPVTHATTSHRDLLAERFGDGAAALPHFTWMNDGAVARGGTLTIDKVALGLGTIGAVTDAIAAVPLSFTQDAVRLVVSGYFQPGDVKRVDLQ